MLKNTSISANEIGSATPLVRERSTVQSCPAAPCFQRVSQSSGPEKTSKKPEQIQKVDQDSCKIRVPVAASLAVLVVVALLYVLVPPREACTSPVTGPQALPWIEDMRSRDMAGCE